MRRAQYCTIAPSCLLSALLSVAAASCSNNQPPFTDTQPATQESANGFLPVLTGNASDDSLTAPPAPVLNLRAAARQLVFSWPAPLAQSKSKIIRFNLVTREYTPVFSTSGNLVTEFALPLAAHRTDWQNTRFLLETCEAEQCLLSGGRRINHLAADLHTIIPRQSVSAGQRHAQSLALSADGKTLVSGAPGYALVQFRVGNQWWDSTVFSGDTQAEDADFARSVAISANGNTVAVGAPGEKNQAGAKDSGAVYLYERLGEGWANTAKLGTTDDSLTGFGTKVVMSDDASLLLVGVPDASVNSQAKAGKVLVYQRISSQWRLSQTLQAENPTARALYGKALSLAGNQGPLFINDKSKQGQVHEYKLHNGQFSLVGSLTSTVSDITQFAESVVSDGTGSTLAVSRRSTSEAETAESPSLEVLVYQRANSGHWQLQQTMAPPGVLSTDSSTTLALSGDASTLSIGVINTGGSSNNVTTYSSDRPWVAGGFIWARNGTLYSPGSGYDEFAYELALSNNGETLIVAAPGASKNGLARSGEVYAW